MKDTLFSTLYLQKLSREFTNFPKNPNWPDLEWLEKAFYDKHPELKDTYLESKKNEQLKWGSNFGDSFQKHHLSTFVMENCNY